MSVLIMNEKSKIMLIKEIASKYLYQGPRYIGLGPNSGEQFRENILLPWLDDLGDAKGIIDFEDTRMFSPSFLEEAFGGAVRLGYKSQISSLAFKNMPDSWERDVKKYIADAISKLN